MYSIPSRSKRRSPPSLNGGPANPAQKPHLPRDAAAYEYLKGVHTEQLAAIRCLAEVGCG